MSGTSEDLKLILQRNRDGVYSKAWRCPSCLDGWMEAKDEVESRDCLVVCEDCGHECRVCEMVFVRGDVCTLVDALTAAESRAKKAEAEVLKLSAALEDRRALYTHVERKWQKAEAELAAFRERPRAVFNLAMQYVHEHELYPTTYWCGVDVEANQLSHDPECPLCADDTAEMVRRLLLWTKKEHEWQAERKRADEWRRALERRVSQHDATTAELAALRGRIEDTGVYQEGVEEGRAINHDEMAELDRLRPEMDALQKRVREVAEYLQERGEVQGAAGFPASQYECDVAHGFVLRALEGVER